MVEIDEKRFEELLDKEFKLNCLENGGVDNWEWYDQALEDGGYFDEDEQ